MKFFISRPFYDDDAVIMDTSTNPLPSLRVNSKSKVKKPKRVPRKKRRRKNNTLLQFGLNL